MSGHHLILGTVKDRLTGETIEDSHDERYRQKIVGHLLDLCGYDPSEIEANRRIELTTPGRMASFPVDFIVHIDGVAAMVVRYGPGSLVTRYRTAQALCRFLADHEIPVAIVTNGEEAHRLDGPKGACIAQGFHTIPTRSELSQIILRGPLKPVSRAHRAMAERLLFAYEVDGSCPCDESICRMDPDEG